ncbi:MAG: glycosyltransferase family 39 protein [Nanoarchaeota archaeon]
MEILRIFKNQYFWLFLIIIFALFVRLYKIDSPIADWHSWRQADTAAVTRNFIKEGFNPLLPKYDDMSTVSEVLMPNPSRFRFVEFPVYNIFVYPFYLLFGVNEAYHRFVSVIFSLGSAIFLFFIVKRFSGIFEAFVATTVFSFLPYNVFFSRTTLPEPTFVFFSLGMVYFVSEWIEKEDFKNLFPAFFFTSIAFLIKPWAVFFYLPLLYLVFKKRSILKRFILFSLLAFTPFIGWRLWILQQPQGIPASSWLLNGDGIRLRPAFWWWIVSERIGREILGATGFVLFCLGLIFKSKNGYFFHIFVLSIFLFFTIFATGNVRHDYYQILFVPASSVMVALGFIQLIRGGSSLLPRIFTIPLALLLFILTFYFGFKQISGLYQINNPAIVEAGRVADQILPEDAVVAAPYNGDSAFLYQVNRIGWPLVPGSLKSLIADFGVTHYISTTKDNKTNWVMRHFKILVDAKDYVIVDLTKMSQNFNQIADPEP